MKKSEIIKKANSIVPSRRQIEFVDMEFIGLIHFGMNTYTNSEEGTGREPGRYFAPPAVDAQQWVQTLKSAGMKGLILTCKHSDGFCIWQSEYTDHCMKTSPYLDGKGDIVKAVSDECKKQGLKFGIYISPQDKHEKTFGTNEYNTFFNNQLTELLTNYGDIFCVWFPRDTKTDFQYNWEMFYKTVRKYQPEASICSCGPDFRWVGNSGNIKRSEEWSVVPYDLLNNAPLQKLVEPDLGSVKKLKKAKELVWLPPVTMTSIRPRWFFHKEEETDLKLLSKILDIYFRSVGNNGTMILSIPPSHMGVIDRKDVESLRTLGAQLKLEFKENHAKDGVFTASHTRDEMHKAETIKLPNGYWHSGEASKKITLEVDMGEVKFINKVVLGENISTGQQIEKFNLYYFFDGKWKKIYSGNTIGRKKICDVSEMNARRIRLEIVKTREFATIKTFEVY